MPKTIVSPVKKFAGELVLHDPLNVDQYLELKDALDKFEEIKDKSNIFELIKAVETPLIRCVKEWKIAGLSGDRLPATPVKSAADFFAWLIGQVTELLVEHDEIPNA